MKRPNTLTMNEVAELSLHKVKSENFCILETLMIAFEDIFENDSMIKSRYMEIHGFMHDFFSSLPRVEQNDITKFFSNNCNTKRESVNTHKSWKRPRIEIEDVTINHCYDDFYQTLRNYLNCFLGKHYETIDLSTGETQLRKYTELWQNFKFKSKVLNSLCETGNRRRNLDLANQTKNSDEYNIFQYALYLWKELLLSRTQSKINHSLLQYIKTQRQSVKFSLDCDNLVREIILSFSEAKHGSSYQNSFETKFLTESKVFYENYSRELMTKMKVSYVEKLRTIGKRLSSEETFRNHLNSKTFKDLMEICRKSLVEDHIEFYESAFKSLLESLNRTSNNDDYQENLQRMYILVKIVPKLFISIVDIFKNYIILIGRNSIDEIMCPQRIDPKKFVEALLHTHNQYEGLINSCFDGNRTFKKALDEAFITCINSNSITSKFNTNKPAELLARYCNCILKKSNKLLGKDNELEQILEQVMMLFSYLESKDAFQACYTTMYALRLCQDSSVSADIELLMVEKLKQRCGNDYVKKLHRITKEVGISSEINNEFLINIDQNLFPTSFMFEARILPSLLLPFTFPSNEELALPNEFQCYVTAFERFYRSKFSTRNLKWIHSQSSAEIAFSQYVFQMSTLQSGVILLFNHKTEYMVEEIEELTKISNPIIQKILQLLIQFNILKVHSQDLACSKLELLNEKTIIAYNPEYQHNKKKINVNKPISFGSDKKLLESTLDKTVSVQRSFLTQAAIVRIMKVHRVYTVENLNAGVVQQLSSRFKPTHKLLRRCIDRLVEKSYLKWKDVATSTLEYIPG